jgi:metallo-beta-lactamase class B
MRPVALRLSLVLLLAPPLMAGTFTEEWNRPFPPHRVAGNIYYVGTNALASFLITGDKGHILINPDFEQSVPVIQASVEKLGFRMRDIKITWPAPHA